MGQAHIAVLPKRGVVAATGPEARQFLDNIVTNDLSLLDQQDAIHAALLTPQGKILFDLFIVKVPDGFLLETGASAADLVKRLTIYRLRAKVTLNNLSESRVVVAVWGGPPPVLPLAVSYQDPRAEKFGTRLIMAPEMATKLAGEDEGPAAYDRHRIANGIPEPGRDFKLGDTFPHEANLDRLGGISFTKGCFVGQEVVARMQHKTVVRKRVVRVTGEAALPEGEEVRVGEGVIGRIGSASGTSALAMVRLDRAMEASKKGVPLSAAGVPIKVDPEDLDAYAKAAEARARTGA